MNGEVVCVPWRKANGSGRRGAESVVRLRFATLRANGGNGGFPGVRLCRANGHGPRGGRRGKAVRAFIVNWSFFARSGSRSSRAGFCGVARIDVFLAA